MLTRTFLHLPGVGPRTEATFWKQGLTSWEDFLEAPVVPGLGRPRLNWLKACLRESLEHLDHPRYFADRLSVEEHWRLWRRYRARTVYLDIETHGSIFPGVLVTVVGLYDGESLRQFVQGRNLKDLPRALASFDLVVTFNGAAFDLPVLKANFSGLRLPSVHLDLRFLLAQLGFKGGLKGIEPRFGIKRPREVRGLNGYDAVLLWERHQRGDRTALERLLAYNREDVVNLERLMAEAYRLHAARLGVGES